MQGDSYSLEIEILYDDNTILAAENVSDIEMMIGTLRKTYANGDILFEDGVWKIHLTQQETFRLPPSRLKIQVRVALPSGDVQGYSLGEIRIRESDSKEVL